MKSIILGLLCLLSVSQIAIAAPPYPLEGLLPRAETVFIGAVTKQNDKKVGFTVCQRLRGENKNEFTLELAGISSQIRLEPNSRYFVISQGDNHSGKPEPIVTLGQRLIGQAGYCGWIMFPIKNNGEETYLEHIASHSGDGRWTLVTLDQAKTIVGQIPYDPDIHGKQQTQTIG